MALATWNQILKTKNSVCFQPEHAIVPILGLPGRMLAGGQVTVLQESSHQGFYA